MIKLVALIYLALNGAVETEPVRLVNSVFVFDTVEACEAFKVSETGLRAEAALNLQLVRGLAESSGVTLHEISIVCHDATPKREA